jgi:hypothetical protein
MPNLIDAHVYDVLKARASWNKGKVCIGTKEVCDLVAADGQGTRDLRRTRCERPSSIWHGSTGSSGPWLRTTVFASSRNRVGDHRSVACRHSCHENSDSAWSLPSGLFQKGTTMQVEGISQVVATLLSLKDRTFRKVVTAVEKTAVRIANDARAGHEHGSDPHSRDRYENQTSNLTNSISPGGPGGLPMTFERLDENAVVGLVGVLSTAPSAVMNYAAEIEEKYPFVWPAAVANIENFRQEIAKAANPDSK